MFSEEAIKLAKPLIKAIKKISKWKPERFDRFVLLSQGEQKGTVWSFNEKTQKIEFLGDAPDQAEINDWRCIVEHESSTGRGLRRCWRGWGIVYLFTKHPILVYIVMWAVIELGKGC